MSYLLDALKKAEQERKKEQGDTVVAPVAVSAPSSIPVVMIWIVAGLILITVVKMFWPDSDSHHANQTVGETAQVKGVAQIDSSHGVVVSSDTADRSKNEASEVAPSVVMQPIKELMELDEATLNRIPSISLESHIFSPVAEYRSVIINGNSYSENALLSAGVVLSEITKDGVTLMVGQQPVHLPKGITWVSTKHAQ